MKPQTSTDSLRDFTVDDERSTTVQTVQDSSNNHDDKAASSGVDFQTTRKRKRKNLCSEDEDVVKLNAVEKKNERPPLHSAALNDVTNTGNQRQNKKKRN